MRKLLLTAITLAGLAAPAAADVHIHVTNVAYNVTAVALDSVQNDDNVTSMGLFVSVTDLDGAPVQGLQPSDFTATLLAGDSVSGDLGEVAPGVYHFGINIKPDPFGVQGRSAVALVAVHHWVSAGVNNFNVYGGQAMARADFTRATVSCRR
jgi:hypothetical protein